MTFTSRRSLLLATALSVLKFWILGNSAQSFPGQIPIITTQPFVRVARIRSVPLRPNTRITLFTWSSHLDST